MALYPDSLAVGEARERFFRGLGAGPDGGYSAAWVKLKAGPIPFCFPNLSARVRAVRLHDLHHIATGYEPSWVGEAEVGAWELASGCRGYWAAWVLNSAAFAAGLFLAPARVFRAFVRGRHSTNLYAEGFREALLSENLGLLRKRLGVSEPRVAVSSSDVLAFVVWVSFTLLAMVMIIGVLILAAYFGLRLVE